MIAQISLHRAESSLFPAFTESDHEPSSLNCQENPEYILNANEESFNDMSSPKPDALAFKL